MSDVNARIPGPYLVQALDDNGDGVADNDVWLGVKNAVETEINGTLGQRFKTPFINPVPAIVLDSARVLACDMLYKRRGIADKENPWSKQAADFRARLADIVAGKQPLTPDLNRAQPSVSVVSEKSKTTSSQAKIST